ncbi:hypothetical protein HETIRDRAFT_99964 [Heterobasidion irregulare TC 32-1]|uniref:Uncharacterized protein n=1 Tax=Heterobasidion irregulare (strain TC 32-1) TaxID=747525 RepID=W4KPA3_HETIT|nr:uncharacterized protein HETIRDRAFT_99964 [Heterobasidion irregulare TC 32-1]ETW87642.1 hypothetical protein HETIRDRAFT_99964 [Heterobasidion irregulare TC 32-1]
MDAFELKRPSKAAELFNITIDDSGEDPVTGALIQYLPNFSFDPTLSNTVTAAYVPFTGTANHVFCIIAHTSSSPDGNADLQFFIDNEVCIHERVPFKWALRFDDTERTNRGSEVVVVARQGHVQLDQSQDDSRSVSSTVAFTSPAGTSTFPAGTPKTSKSVSYAPIVGGVVGGLAFILALGGLFLFLRRQRRQQYSGNTIHLQASESAHRNSGSSSRLMSRAPLSRPSLDNPFRIDPILPGIYTSPLGPLALPRPFTSTDAAISSQSNQAHVMAEAIPLLTPRRGVPLSRVSGSPRPTHRLQHHFHRVRDDALLESPRENGLIYETRMRLLQRM